MRVRDGDDEGAAHGVEGREVPVACARVRGLRRGRDSVEVARENSGVVGAGWHSEGHGLMCQRHSF